jgi:retron-type reverse transcriptase
LENLLAGWEEFTRGKKKRKDVQEFGFRLMDNLALLHDDLITFRYRHGGYHAFTIADPKPRNIHKASVRDRVLHHALYHMLYPFFDRTFIFTSFSCRNEKGTHKALDCFNTYARIVSRNHTHTCWVLKMDIRKFFASIDQNTLLKILSTYISDQRILWLLEQVIFSFHSTHLEVGLPLGNLTSQLLVNIYMNEFDQFAKHRLKAKYYIRYADDFVLLSTDRLWLEQQITLIDKFLREYLHLTLHPDKVSIQTFASGVDFLGWVHFSNHRVPRTTTKRRMFKRIQEHPTPETVQSYLGLLGHGDTFNLRREILDWYLLNTSF